MLAANNRLSSSRAIARVMTRGRYASSGPLLVKWSSRGDGPSRAVVVVSKKVSKKAVVRNRIRRRLSAQLAEEWATVPGGYDIVVSARADLAEVPAAEIKRVMREALERARLRS